MRCMSSVCPITEASLGPRIRATPRAGQRGLAWPWPGSPWVAAACLLLAACSSPHDTPSERVCDTSELPCEWDGQCKPELCKYPYPSAPTCTNTVVIGNLEWTQCDNGQDINAMCAACYAKNLSLGGNRDWRLPTIDQLASLYVPSDAIVDICGMAAVLSIDSRVNISCVVAVSSTVKNNDPVHVQAVNFGADATYYVNDVVGTYDVWVRALGVRGP
jgi:hypothetical protein